MEGYVEAYTLFAWGEQSFIAKKYSETIDLFRRAYNLVGEDGLRMLENIFDGTKETYIKQYEFHATMCKSYYQLGEYEKALEHGNQWRIHVINHYGNDSILLVDCYKQLALIHLKQRLPEKQFDEQHGSDLSWNDFLDILTTHIQVYPLGLQNLQLPMDYYMKAYNLLKNKKGTADTETRNLKQEIVEFQWSEWLAMQVEKTLWIATFLVPILLILTPLIFGITWEAFLFFIFSTLFFLIWRIADAGLMVWMTYSHYQKSIN